MGNLAEYFRQQAPTQEQIADWSQTYQQALAELAITVDYPQAITLTPCRPINEIPLNQPKSMTVDELADTIRVLDAAQAGTNIQAGLVEVTQQMSAFIAAQPQTAGNI